jgi:hypothetical protein
MGQSMKYYEVIDHQGGGFMADTQKHPETLNSLRSRFWSLGDSRTEKFNEFTSDYIQEMWHVEFIEV